MSTSYQIKESLRGEYRPRAGGPVIEIDLEPGEFKPASDGELELAEHLVTLGVAETSAPAKRAQRKG